MFTCDNLVKQRSTWCVLNLLGLYSYGFFCYVLTVSIRQFMLVNKHNFLKDSSEGNFPDSGRIALWSVVLKMNMAVDAF